LKDLDKSDFPIPEPIEETGQLTINEFSYILDTTLKKSHRHVPHVISFIDAFVRCKSIRQASEEAGIHREVGYRLRHSADVANAIQALTDKSSVKYGFDNSEIFERVKEVVEFDPIMMQNKDGSFKSNLADVEPEARRNIKKMKVRNIYNQDSDINGMKKQIIVGEIIEYEFYDKLKAAELTGREKEMFKNTTKVEHTVTRDMQNILLESARRADEREKQVTIDVTPKIPRPF